MTLLKNITFAVCVMSLVYVVLGLLTPERYRRKMKTVVSTLSALAVAGTFLGNDFAISSEKIFKDGELSLGGISQTDMVLSELDLKLADYLLPYYKEKGIPIEKITVKTNIDGEGCIFISKISLTVSGKKELYEDAIKRLTADNIGKVSLEMSFSEEADGS